MLVSGALSAVDYPKASSSALACYKWLQGTAGGVGESSGIDRLTDVPECREDKFSEAPRKEKPLVHNQATSRGMDRCSLCGEPKTRLEFSWILL